MGNVSNNLHEMKRVVRFIPKSNLPGLRLSPGEQVVGGYFDCNDQDQAPIMVVVRDIPVSEAVPEDAVGVFPAKQPAAFLGSFVPGDGYNTRTIIVRKH